MVSYYFNILSSLLNKQAIMMAVAQSDVEILGITTVEGNSTVDKTTINALRVLNVCNAKVLENASF